MGEISFDYERSLEHDLAFYYDNLKVCSFVNETSRARIENKWYPFKHRTSYLILWFSLLDFLLESQIAQMQN